MANEFEFKEVSSNVEIDTTLKEQGKAADAKATGDAIDQAKGSVTASLQSRVAKSDIADNLTTNDATKVLSAKQGVELSNRISGVSESLGKNLLQAQNGINANTEDISDLNTRVNALESNPPSGGGGSASLTPWFLNNANVGTEVTEALNDFIANGTPIVYNHEGDNCTLVAYEDSLSACYFVVPNGKKLLKIDLSSGMEFVVTEMDFCNLDGNHGGGASVELDTTLTQSGKAADAKAVGDRFDAIIGPFSTGLSYTLKTDGTYEVSGIGLCGVADILIPHIWGGRRVTSIGQFAFHNATGIKSVKIPDSIKEIGNGAFSGCLNLVSVTMPNDVMNILGMAFYNCSLKNVVIPKSVDYIGPLAFDLNDDLTIICEAETKPAKWAIDWCGNTQHIIWGAKLDFGDVNKSLKELDDKALDKVRYIDFGSGANIDVECDSFNITWRNDDTEIEVEDWDGNTQYIYTGGARFSVPIVAGNNVTFEQDGNVVKINAEGGGGGGGVANLMTPITYAELKALRDGSQLTAGMFYRITDYVCTTTQADTRAMSNKFDIIVQALSENTLSEIAKADYHVEDGDDTIVGTWVFNDELTGLQGMLGSHYLIFSASSNTDGTFTMDELTIQGTSWYTVSYFGEERFFEDVYDSDDGWLNNDYKTITIIEEPTDTEFIAWLKANATKQAEGSGEPKFKPEVLADDDGTLVEDAIVAQYYIFDDFDDAGGDATEAGYKADDKFIAYDYLENYDGDIVPVIYKTDMVAAEDSPDEYGSPDYEDTFYYVGTEVLDGVTYDKWRKINQVDGNGMDWQGHGSVHVLTNVVIGGGSSGGTGKGYFKNSNLPAWEIKYCLDNDTTRFAWAMGQAITNLDSGYSNGRPLTRQPSMDGKDGNTDVYYYAWGVQEDADDGDPSNLWYSKTKVLSNGDTVYSDFDYQTVEIIEGKGVIYYMKDEFNNECPYDFKNIQFKRTITLENGYPEPDEQNGEETWVYTFCATSYHIDNDEWSRLKDGSLESPYCHQSDEHSSTFHDNIIGERVLLYDLEDEDYTKCGKQYLNNNVFFGWWEEIDSTSADNYPYYYARCCWGNKFGFGCINNTLMHECNCNTFGNNCEYNNMANGCSRNSLGDFCNGNVLLQTCYNNNLSGQCYDNILGVTSNNNTFGFGCGLNIFGDGCSRNTLGDSCVDITLGYGCSCNIFGAQCVGISFNGLCNGNKVGFYCRYINVAGDNIQVIEICSRIMGYSSDRLTIGPAPNANYQQIYRKSGSTETFV